MGRKRALPARLREKVAAEEVMDAIEADQRNTVMYNQPDDSLFVVDAQGTTSYCFVFCALCSSSSSIEYDSCPLCKVFDKCLSLDRYQSWIENMMDYLSWRTIKSHDCWENKFHDSTRVMQHLLAGACIDSTLHTMQWLSYLSPKVFAQERTRLRALKPIPWPGFREVLFRKRNGCFAQRLLRKARRCPQ